MADSRKFYYKLTVGTTITDPEALDAHLKRMLGDVRSNSGGSDEPWEFEVFCESCQYAIGTGDHASGIIWDSSCEHSPDQ